MLGTDDARAQETRGYTTCFFAHQESVDVSDEALLQTPPRHRLIAVPPGWEVVGGGGSGVNTANILFCRR